MQSGRLAENVTIALYVARYRGRINPNSIMRRDFDQPLPSLHIEKAAALERGRRLLIRPIDMLQVLSLRPDFRQAGDHRLRS